jgi:hypothetical protein
MQQPQDLHFAANMRQRMMLPFVVHNPLLRIIQRNPHPLPHARPPCLRPSIRSDLPAAAKRIVTDHPQCGNVSLRGGYGIRNRKSFTSRFPSEAL